MLRFVSILASAITAPPSATHVCEAMVGAPAFSTSWARVEIDRAHAIVDRYLIFSTRDYKASWTVERGSLDATATAKRLRLPVFGLPDEVAYPVTLTFLVDGREVAQQRFFGPSTQVVYGSGLAPHWVRVPLNGRGYYHGVELGLNSPPVPNLFGATSAELVASSAGGERIGVIQLQLPEWLKLADSARLAFIALEARRMRRMCTTPAHIIITGN